MDLKLNKGSNELKIFQDQCMVNNNKNKGVERRVHQLGEKNV
jgi:hypothetical protein